MSIIGFNCGICFVFYPGPFMDFYSRESSVILTVKRFLCALCLALVFVVIK